ncbi:MAG: sigma-70 family RNA polymerase sigma factor [Armatimonadota bacterium]|nr:sigma-70 family RNA polymerase sigma factor [Armatimonadota bacterium]MDR7452730.1 sigma-70 family RNA polymerase sigma factor [Armatimonadota bacterium]MDR7467621.1 sigma-70 family RNA polymerase sigma factor [Armatimonadota bacterium]MDR7494418.1 sigma-70 family RNA polymerase sigma factor [Armatimonadota bacterium]MDR7505036.1 sigma-70 family RNA polymerase sigma factor [Armatimonadota bacterium]
MGAGVLVHQREYTAEDRARFEAMVSEHLDGLFGASLRLTRNRTRAEDLLQETFLRAWRSFHTFRPGTNVRAWLYRILMNAYIDGYRKGEREPEVVDQEDVDEFYLYSKVHESEDFRRAGNPEELLLSSLMDADVKGALDSLPEAFRNVVILADIEGFSYREIAEILGIPIGTVMSRLHRGRRQLQVKLWEYARRARYVGAGPSPASGTGGTR